MLFLIIMWLIASAGAVGMSYFLFKISVPVSKVGLLRVGYPTPHKRGR